MRLLELLHEFVVVCVHVRLVFVKDVLRLLLALEKIEEGIARNRLYNDALLASLLVLLSLFDFLFGGVLALFPVDDGAFDLDCLIRVVVHDRCEAECLVCEELVFAEGHSHCELGRRKFDLTAVQLGQVLQDGSIFICDHGLKHGMVLDSLCPKVRYAGLVFQVVNIGLFAGLLLLFIGLFLLVSLDDTGNGCLQLSEGRVEVIAKVIELLLSSFEDSVTLLQDGELALLEGLAKFAHFLLKLIVNLATLVGEHIQALEALLHVLRHAGDNLDHLLLHLFLSLADREERFFLLGAGLLLGSGGDFLLGGGSVVRLVGHRSLSLLCLFKRVL